MNPKIAKMFASAVKSPDRRAPWRWAEDHVKSLPFSPIPGAFRSSNSPWVREPLEAIVNPRIKLVSIIASVQSSKTTIPEIALCYIIKNLPGPTLWLDQTDEDAKDQSESRLQKMFNECEPVKQLYPANRHHKRNNTIHFANGMTLWMLGAHNIKNLQRRSIRWLIGDETWRWPQGHMAEAEARVTAFGWLGKCIFMSQGGEEGDDTHRKFESTDMCEWTFACPKCSVRQPFLWENVEWSKDARREDGTWNFGRVIETTSLKCPHCGSYHSDTDAMRHELNATGKFVPQNLNASPGNVGFHWNALCAMSWGKLAELYLRGKAAARQGDTSLMQQFYQKRLGLPWKEFVEDFKIEITRSGYKMGELWGAEAGIGGNGRIVSTFDKDDKNQIPLRILTVDCQMDHFFLVVRAWTAEGSSRLLWVERVITWEDIEMVQSRFAVHPNLVFVDAGYNSYEVYRQCARWKWIALMGDRRATFSHKAKNGIRIERFYSPLRKVFISQSLICRMHFFSNLSIKDMLARLRRNQESTNGATWEIPDDVPEDYLAHLESEQRVQKHGRWQWEQIGNRTNHWFDCEVMNIAAAVMLKIIGREAEFCHPAMTSDGEAHLTSSPDHGASD